MQCFKGLTVQRRKWRVLALLNTEATRDPSNEDNKVIFNIQSSENIYIPPDQSDNTGHNGDALQRQGSRLWGRSHSQVQSERDVLAIWRTFACVSPRDHQSRRAGAGCLWGGSQERGFYWEQRSWDKPTCSIWGSRANDTAIVESANLCVTFVYTSQAALVSLGPIWVYSAPTFHVKVWHIFNFFYIKSLKFCHIYIKKSWTQTQYFCYGIAYHTPQVDILPGVTSMNMVLKCPDPSVANPLPPRLLEDESGQNIYLFTWWTASEYQQLHINQVGWADCNPSQNQFPTRRTTGTRLILQQSTPQSA